MIKFELKYKDIISSENLLGAWQEFIKDKRKRKDVQEFQYNLSDNLVALKKSLEQKTYYHKKYYAFNISDPKPRNIHKATVEDRILHRAIYRKLYPYFDFRFISDSYSCRLDKGTHRGFERFRAFARQVSKNDTKICWVLKCDIRKFFASIDHENLLNILKTYIPDEDIIWLLGMIISSFCSNKPGIGLPLGNLTSQLIANIYMNTFDQWTKHIMKAKYYIRYADDFVILHQEKDYLLELTPKIVDFLEENLKLSLHPNKVSVNTLSSGVDFLGWVHFPHHRVLRTATKRKMFRNLNSKQGKQKENSAQSYLGMLGWGNARKLADEIQNMI
ncbi:MAG TPA: reverse transcriptase/maturase family protein [Candidatus Paceibacterota bacterium]